MNSRCGSQQLSKRAPRTGGRFRRCRRSRGRACDGGRKRCSTTRAMARRRMAASTSSKAPNVYDGGAPTSEASVAATRPRENAASRNRCGGRGRLREALLASTSAARGSSCAPTRRSAPDSLYGVWKAFDEALGRYYSDVRGLQGQLRAHRLDHPNPTTRSIGAQLVERGGRVGFQDGERGGVGLEVVAGQGRRSAAGSASGVTGVRATDGVAGCIEAGTLRRPKVERHA
jgi:hypothetical protein